MLELQGVHTYYGLSHVLQGVSLRVEAGELVSLIGRNGAGKSTTLKTIMGITPAREGRISFANEDITAMPAHLIPRLGIAYVPEDRRIIPGLSVFENLKLAMLPHKSRLVLADELEKVYGYFPRLKERHKQDGTSLSGGEQQMLAMARGLITNPRMLLIDEPTQGLAPVFVRNVTETVSRIRTTGVGILFVEQNAEVALGLADRAYVIDHGVIQVEGPAAFIREIEDIRRQFLTV
jgi:branched-chain amino acid transport system ATP-binding protein